MTIYSIELTKLLGTVSNTLAQRVLPTVTDGTARLELLGVLEQLENLATRVSWDRDRLGAVCNSTEQLAARLGLEPTIDTEPGVESLRARRTQISGALARAYAEGPDGDVVEAIRVFTDGDVVDQISTTLRSGLPSA